NRSRPCCSLSRPFLSGLPTGEVSALRRRLPVRVSLRRRSPVFRPPSLSDALSGVRSGGFGFYIAFALRNRSCARPIPCLVVVPWEKVAGPQSHRIVGAILSLRRVPLWNASTVLFWFLIIL
ncbi:hypothetical protein Taro_009368, partial [Colocasia esculenta]|nr:hypothetical protein [Colocasia esculenta]